MCSKVTFAMYFLIECFGIYSNSDLQNVVFQFDASNSSVVRDLKTGFSFATFELYKFTYAHAQPLQIIRVKTQKLCHFHCVKNLNCTSYNVAEHDNSEGNYQCEILNAIMTNSLTENQNYHHYSIKGSSSKEKYDVRPCNGKLCEIGCVIFDFENGLQNWIMTGTAFDNQPTYGDNSKARNRGTSSHSGDYWIGTFENRASPSYPAGSAQGDNPRGSITSFPFTITGSKLEFLIGGGCDITKVRAELLIGGTVIAKATGKCRELMERSYWNVSQFWMKKAQLRLVDDSSRAWGHINFDNLIYITC